MHYLTDVLKKYATFSGRAARKEFWMFYLFYILSMTVLVILPGVAIAVLPDGTEKIVSSVLSTLFGIFALGTLLPYIAVIVRRLHDISKSGWWILISLIPIVGGIWLIVLLATKGDAGTNNYGADPYGVTSEAPIAPSPIPQSEPTPAAPTIENVVVAPPEPTTESDVDKVIVKPDLPASEF